MHIPVLKKEVIEALDIKSNQNFIDGTFHRGGHGLAILEENKPNGKLLGIEIDEDIYNIAKKEISNDRLVLVNDSYANLKSIVEEYNFKDVSGILLDVGMSSWHIDESEKGFSFMKDEELDMRFGRGDLTAKEIVNTYPQDKLEYILKEYGEERYAKKIAKAIIESRPISTTKQLADLIKRRVPYSRIHPATRTFQALRIETNQELENIKKVLPQALDILNEKGKLIIISFHSLEDRIVKQFIKENNLNTLYKKPITPTLAEVKENSRARSAKLRVIIK
jgi:16S rRNA (cytosine1402-N4)-methyltransferase